MIFRESGGPAESRRFQSWVYEGSPLEVAKYDGSLQCEMGQAVSLDQMEKELHAASIAVEAKAKRRMAFNTADVRRRRAR